MEQQLIPLSLSDTFRFSCSKDVPCFNQCCRDLNQFLTPYDILRLKNHFKISSNQFLDHYTVEHIGPETGLPVVSLKQNADSNSTCPFVTDTGCSVYPNRPSSCRAYPLARILSRSRETGQVTEHYALLKEAHCQGFDQDRKQTVEQWVTEQEIRVYNEMNDPLMEIIALKNRHIPGSLDIKLRHIFHIAMYDLDQFRKNAFEENLFQGMNIDSNTLDRAAEDDTQLLKLAFGWIRYAFFGSAM